MSEEEVDALQQRADSISIHYGVHWGGQLQAKMKTGLQLIQHVTGPHVNTHARAQKRRLHEKDIFVFFKVKIFRHKQQM